MASYFLKYQSFLLYTKGINGEGKILLRTKNLPLVMTAQSSTTKEVVARELVNQSHVSNWNNKRTCIHVALLL